jgi:hypothetical protein
MIIFRAQCSHNILIDTHLSTIHMTQRLKLNKILLLLILNYPLSELFFLYHRKLASEQSIIVYINNGTIK